MDSWIESTFVQMTSTLYSFYPYMGAKSNIPLMILNINVIIYTTLRSYCISIWLLQYSQKFVRWVGFQTWSYWISIIDHQSQGIWFTKMMGAIVNAWEWSVNGSNKDQRLTEFIPKDKMWFNIKGRDIYT